MTILLIIAIAFVAAFQQTLTGFGFALIIMPLMVLILGLRTAAPMVALAGFTVYLVNLIRHWQAVDRKEVLRLAAGSALGVPVGIWALTAVEEGLVQGVLGVVLIGYGLYALLQPTLPRLAAQGWGYVAGFFSGCLGGAYNTPGPPVIVYCSLRQWPKEEFRAILQAIFLVNATLVVGSHLLAGNMTLGAVQNYLVAMPAIFLGILAGSRLDARVNRDRFRTIVIITIIGLGVSLLL